MRAARQRRSNIGFSAGSETFKRGSVGAVVISVLGAYTSPVQTRRGHEFLRGRTRGRGILAVERPPHRLARFTIQLLLLAALCVLQVPTPAMDLPLRGVVKIDAQTEAKRRQGTGFVVRVTSEGVYIVTAGHVVEGVKHPRVAPAANPNVWSRARTLRLDPDGDLAVLLVDSARANEHYAKIPLAADVPKLDQEVTVIGFPRFLGGLSILPGRATLKGQSLVFSQRLEEGFSGSPMLLDGRIAGIVTRSTPQRGVGVTVDAVRNFLRGAGIRSGPDLDVEYIRQWGVEGDGEGQFRTAWGIATLCCPTSVYVSDSGKQDGPNIQVFTGSGRYLGGVRGWVAMGNRLDLGYQGRIYVLNYDSGTAQNQRIDVYRPYAGDDYRIETRIALNGRAPRGLATDGQRQVYVTDISNNSVSRYDEGGRLTKRWGRAGQGPGEFNDPWGIAVDRYRDRRVYVADSGNHRVQAFTPDGRFLTSWGSKGKGDGQFDWPIDIAVDREHGYVYVLDSRNARVQVFEPDGTFLGRFGTHGAEQGELLEPSGIALDGDRHCYVLDTGNFRVQMFSIAWH